MRTLARTLIEKPKSPHKVRVPPEHKFNSEVRRINSVLGSLITICFLISVLSSAMYVLMTPGCESTLIDLQGLAVVFRHGERYRAVPVRLRGALEPGELTANGQEQISKLGKKLRLQYRGYFSRVRSGRLITFNGIQNNKTADLFMQAVGLGSLEAIQIPVESSQKLSRERRKIFKEGILECLKKIGVPRNEVDEKIRTYFQSLCKIVVADSLDMIGDIQSELPPDFEQPRGIRTSILLAAEFYRTMTKLAVNTFAKPAVKKFIEEVRSLRRYAGNSRTPSMLAFSMSDVGISGFLSLINPEKSELGRPGYGAHLLFNFFQEDVEVFYAPTFEASSEVWLPRGPLDKFLQKLTQASNTRKVKTMRENAAESSI